MLDKYESVTAPASTQRPNPKMWSTVEKQHQKYRELANSITPIPHLTPEEDQALTEEAWCAEHGEMCSCNRYAEEDIWQDYVEQGKWEQEHEVFH